MKISAVYKITNTITGDFYIGSSKNVKHRWAEHKCKSSWKKFPNNPMYLDMQKYGVDKFEFEIIEEVEEDSLKEKEQQFIEMLKPSYNNINANGWDFERYKESRKEYRKTDKYKEYHKQYEKTDKRKKYRQSDKYKESQNKYNKSDKGKETRKQYNNQLCNYNGETLTLRALSARFKRKGIDHSIIEAKKYLIV